MNTSILIKAKSLGLTLFLATSFSAVHAAEQVITPSSNTFNSIIANKDFEFKLTYTSDDIATSGVGVKMFFDSSKLIFSGLTATYENGVVLINDKKSNPDADNGDKDSSTDSIINAAWLDFSPTPNWPGATPVDLYTARFKAAANFTGSTVIKFKGSPAAQSTLILKDITITTAAVAGDSGTNPGTTPAPPPRKKSGGSVSWLFLMPLALLGLFRRRL